MTNVWSGFFHHKSIAFFFCFLYFQPHARVWTNRRYYGEKSLMVLGYHVATMCTRMLPERSLGAKTLSISLFPC